LKIILFPSWLVSILFYNIIKEFKIVNGTWAYFGSANSTGAGMGSRTRKGRNNFEIGTITVDREAISIIEKLL